MVEDKIQLDETETLKLELVELKLGTAQRAVVGLTEEYKTLVKGIEDRLGIEDLSRYKVGKTGEGVLITQPIGVENGRGKETGS
jgi:hypothetical protein